MAAKLACGNTLDMIPNDITLKTPASFEPSIDYVVTKIPRFAFEKFPGAQPVLTTQARARTTHGCCSSCLPVAAAGRRVPGCLLTRSRAPPVAAAADEERG